MIFRDQNRPSLDSDSSSADADELVYLPAMDFEFVEVDADAAHQRTDESIEQQADEFEFPLFASAGGSHGGTESNHKLMTINIVPESIEEVMVEREPLYYFAKYLIIERNQFEAAAIDIANIHDSILDDAYPWRVLDVTAHNLRVDREKQAEHKRSGKRSRMNKIASRERKLERSRIFKQLWIQERRLLKKLKPRKHKAFGDEYAGNRTIF